MDKKAHNWINDEIELDFPVPKSLQYLIDRLEELDRTEDYSYFNVSEALDCGAKELMFQGKLTHAQWDLLCAKYDGM